MVTRVFVAAPFSEPPIKGYKGIFDEILDDHEDLELLFANEYLGQFNLLENLISWMKQSEAVIVDLTPSSDGVANSNVLIELGMALVLKPQSLCCMSRGYFPDAVPADIKGAHVQVYNNKVELFAVIETALEELLGYEHYRDDEEVKSEILRLFRKGVVLARGDVASQLDIEPAMASRLLRLLVEEERLDSEGDGRGRRYYKS